MAIDTSLRKQELLRRYAVIIDKYQKILNPDDHESEAGSVRKTDDRRRLVKRESKVADADRMRNKMEVERQNLRRKMEIQKKREASRRELEQMRPKAGICDPQEVMRDFEKLIGYNAMYHMQRPQLDISFVCTWPEEKLHGLDNQNDSRCCDDQNLDEVEIIG